MAFLLAVLLLAASASAGSLDRAARLVKEGRCAEAEPLLRELLGSDPSPEADYFLGFCLLTRFEHEEAEVHLRRAIDGRRREHAWMHTLAKSLLDRGRTGDALALLDRALSVRDRPEYRFAKAMCEIELGELEAAEGNLEGALGAREPIRFLDRGREVDGRAAAYFELGKLLALRGKDAEGLEALEAAIGIDPRHLEARAHLGLAQRRLGRLEEARSSLSSVLSEKPAHFTALYGLYQTHLALGDREAAQSLGGKLASLGELESRIRFLLSSADSLERTLSAGDVDAKRAVVERRLELGDRLLEASRPEEALQHLLAARRLEPERSETYRRLAEVFQLLGRQEDAEMAYGIARDLAARGRY
jgi:tetratricopeptide (TPR) repeat protein